MVEEVKPTRVTEEELWKTRALNSEKRALAAEVAVGQQKLVQLEEEIKNFFDSMTKKYGPCMLAPDGTLTYRPESQSQPLPTPVLEAVPKEED